MTEIRSKWGDVGARDVQVTDFTCCVVHLFLHFFFLHSFKRYNIFVVVLQTAYDHYMKEIFGDWVRIIRASDFVRHI